MAAPLTSGALVRALSILSTALSAMASSAMAPSAMAQSIGQPMQVYSTRMEALFVKLDANRDGRLDQGELQGRRALERRLLRIKGRTYLSIEDLSVPATQPSGRRLKRRFHKADLNGDKSLSRREAVAIPWIGRHFDRLDGDRDGGVTLAELWILQRSLAPRQRRP